MEVYSRDLTLPTLTSDRDGMYICYVQTEAGMSMVSTTVTGWYSSSIRSNDFSPYYHTFALVIWFAVGVAFIEEPSNQTSMNGSSVTLNCTADGSDPISYQWFKDGSPIQGENRDTLVFDPVMYNDYGVYHCVVNNTVNTIFSQISYFAGKAYNDLTCINLETCINTQIHICILCNHNKVLIFFFSPLQYHLKAQC